MQMRTLGGTGLETAPLVFGGNVLGWTADEKTSFAVLDRFVERGFNAIDTADTYSSFAPGMQGGESETVLGNWLKRRKRRDDVVIMTKVGRWARMPGLSAANIAAAIEGSLRRLQTDYVDVYFAHSDFPETPLEESLEAFSRLVAAGKARVIGASNYTADRLAAALDVSAGGSWPAYGVLQPNYNLCDRADFEENGLRTLAIERGIGVVPYFALASGFLSGKYRSAADTEGAARAKFVSKHLNPRGLAILAAMDGIAAETGATMAQVALAWLIARPGVTAPIVSATSLKQLDDILAAATLELPDAAMRALDAVSG